MADFDSKYSGEQVEALLDQVASGNTGGSEGEVQNSSIIASQIFLELDSSYDDFQVFSHKRGYEEHNREVCQRLIENCFTDKMSNNEVFFVTINGSRDRVPYMETAILESQAEEIVRASFVKGSLSSPIAASIGILTIDAEVLRTYAESGEDEFYWEYKSVIVPSIDAIGSEGESDVYVTEFTFGQVTKNGITVTVSRAFVDAVYSKKIILVPIDRTASYIAAYSSRAETPEKMTYVNLRFFFGGIDYISTLSGSTIPTGGTGPIQVSVSTTTYISGTLSSINGTSLLGGRNIPLTGAIVVNGDTFTPDAKGIVDLGNIEGGGGDVSFIDNDSLQGLPFGYIGGYYRSYEFDGVSSEEVNLGYIDNYYYDTIAIAHNDVLYEERIRGLMGDGKLLGTVVVRVDDSYNLYARQLAPKKTIFGWRIYTDKQLMPDSWVNLENYYTKEEVNSAIATAITTTLNTPV